MLGWTRGLAESLHFLLAEAGAQRALEPEDRPETLPRLGLPLLDCLSQPRGAWYQAALSLIQARCVARLKGRRRKETRTGVITAGASRAAKPALPAASSRQAAL